MVLELCARNLRRSCPLTAIVRGAWKGMVQWIELACLWALILAVGSELRAVASVGLVRPADVFELVVSIVSIGFY